MRASLTPPAAIVPGASFHEAAAGQIRSGADFLTRSQTKEGGFLLSRSPHGYMCPSECLAPARFVTTLVVQSLKPIPPLQSTTKPLILSASDWLRENGGTNPNRGLPQTLERAFVPIPSDRDSLYCLDHAFAPAYGPLRDGLFWANFLYTCSRVSLLPPRLGAFVTHCLIRGDYSPWSFGFAFGPVSSPWTRHACRPLVPLLLFCRALGSNVARGALHDYLLRPYRATGCWNHTTEIALTLLCLLLSAYEGPELAPAIQKLTESQEPDGSWAPNAVFKEGSGYYGSRALTTAWCLEALHRYGTRVSRRS